MSTDDLPTVLEIERASFTTPWSELMFAEEASRLEGRVWLVVEWEGDVVAFGGVMVVEDEAHLMNLAVAEGSRRCGLGSALLGELAAAAVARGATRLTLEVREGNRVARDLYETAGLAEVGTRSGYYADTAEHAIIMWSEDLTAPEERARLGELVTRGREAVAAFAGPCEPPPGEELVLGIETSCDETAASVMRGGDTVLSAVVASQVEEHARFGGVVPEIASRKHTEAIVAVVQAALDEASASFDDLDAIAVTYGPGLVGALVVGVAYAKAAAFAQGIPLVGVNHLEGHIYVNTLHNPSIEPPLIALVVSGGHTSLVLVSAWGEYRTLGETLDDAAGEAFDKVAKVLGLGYPGGPILSKLAAEGDPAAIDFPRAMMNSGDYDFSLSGLKTAVINHIRHEREAGREIDMPDLAASFQAAIVDVQVAKTLEAAAEHGVDTVCLAGGVAANPELRSALGRALESEGKRLIVPPLDVCTDNAVMVAAAGTFRLRRGDRLSLDAEADPTLRLDS
jgi:N6-L-threonylcarbamoyladenine synthase